MGTRVIVLEKFGDGWWKICVEDSQIIGLYPSNYLQEDLNISTNSLQNKNVINKFFFLMVKKLNFFSS